MTSLYTLWYKCWFLTEEEEKSGEEGGEDKPEEVKAEESQSQVTTSSEPPAPPPVPEVDETHTEVIAMVEAAVKLAEEHQIALPPEVYIEVLEIAIKEAEKEIREKTPEGPMWVALSSPPSWIGLLNLWRDKVSQIKICLYCWCFVEGKFPQMVNLNIVVESYQWQNSTKLKFTHNWVLVKVNYFIKWDSVSLGTNILFCVWNNVFPAMVGGFWITSPRLGIKWTCVSRRMCCRTTSSCYRIRITVSFCCVATTR